ncbi:hypothetical protein JXL21_05060 [Candidatus Bathyarchaeota archaeon]|nr:hypothetical protein [Candidatus Bathyarchaeota archaeon]
MRGLIVKERHRDQIRVGEKTQTRRQHKRPFRPGEVLRLKRTYTDYWHPETLIEITGVRVEELGCCTEGDARAEGFQSLRDFKKQWQAYTGQPWRDETRVVVYEFQRWTPRGFNGPHST